MISKYHKAQQAAGPCFYAMQDGDKQARVLAVEGVRAGSAGEMAADFELQRSARPGVRNAIEHIALAWPPGEAEKLSDEAMVQAVRRYLELRGINPAETQWVAIRHHDQDHPHCHLLINRVTNTGDLLPDKFSYLNSAAACRAVEGEMGFVDAAKLGAAQKLAEAEQVANPSPELVQRLRLKHYLAEALEKHQPGAAILDRLRAGLRDEQITVLPAFDKQGKLERVVFTAEQFPGLHMSGSEVARQFSGKQLQQTLETAALRERILTDQAHAQTLRHQATQAEQQGYCGRVAQLRHGELPPVEQRLLEAEAEANATLRGRVMLAQLRAEAMTGPVAAAGAVEQPAVIPPVQQPVLTSPVNGPPAQLTQPVPAIPVTAPISAEPAIDWQARYEQHTRERTAILTHNWAVEKVDGILKRSPDGDGVREAIAYVQQPTTALLPNTGLLESLQHELPRRQKWEDEVQSVVAERARLEKEAKSFFGFGNKAIEAQSKLRHLEMPPAESLQVGPLRFRQVEPPELSKTEFVQQQQDQVAQMRQAITTTLDTGVTSPEIFRLLADRNNIKVVDLPNGEMGFQLRGDSQVYRPSEVVPDFESRFSQSLAKGQRIETNRVQQEISRGRSEGITR